MVRTATASWRARCASLEGRPYLVSGDRDLLSLSMVGTCPIVAAGQILAVPGHA
jgi:hypothetical protein